MPWATVALIYSGTDFLSVLYGLTLLVRSSIAKRLAPSQMTMTEPLSSTFHAKQLQVDTKSLPPSNVPKACLPHWQIR